jgi:hypothetical protein
MIGFCFCSIAGPILRILIKSSVGDGVRWVLACCLGFFFLFEVASV